MLSMGQSGNNSISGQIGTFTAQAALRESSEAAAGHSTRALIDWTGATLAGWRYPVATLLRDALSNELGQGAAQLLVLPMQTATPRLAALLNGTASHVVEMDDIYAPGLFHPGCPTIAAALAAVQGQGGSGERLLRAIAIGYEVGNRIAEAVQPSHYRFWHTTGTVGCFGATAASCVALGLDAAASGHAIGLSATFAAGLQQAFRSESMIKPVHAGRAAEAGLLAAMAARAGLKAEPAMLEGPVGFGKAMSEDVDWQAMLDRLGNDWTIGQMTHKDHACCGHTFAAIDCALALRMQIGFAEQIDRIEIETYTAACEVAGIAIPTTPFEAKFSIAFTVATALLYGKVRLEAFTDERLSDFAIARLLQKIALRPSVQFDAGYPALRGARMTIVLKDGEILEHVQTTRRGSPQWPMSDKDIAEKFVELAEPTLGPLETRALLARLSSIGSSERVSLLC